MGAGESRTIKNIYLKKIRQIYFIQVISILLFFTGGLYEKVLV